MTLESGTHYILVNRKSGTVLDLSGGDGVSILGWSGHGGDNQKWEAIYSYDDSNPVWNFRNVANGRYLGVEGELRDGLRVQGVDWEYQWVLEPQGDDYYRILAPGTPFNVDLTDYGNPENGTPVELWGRWEAENQQWRFERA
ncbi:hypothetical protein AX16_009871 [Volvariella volvacea WC 439]|nr:hypothetical protein AX16_009871 [Volvariella volvacea WC 439]